MSPYVIKAFIVFVFITIVLFDIYLFKDSVPGNTISSVMRGWLKRCEWAYYVFALALGVLTAHWGAL